MPCWVAKLGLVWIMGQLSFGVKGDSYLAWIRTNLFLPWARTQSTLRRGSGGGGRTGKRTPMRGFEASAVPGRSAISVFFGAAVGTLVDRPVQCGAGGKWCIE
jgi:hypothetical protein